MVFGFGFTTINSPHFRDPMPLYGYS